MPRRGWTLWSRLFAVRRALGADRTTGKGRGCYCEGHGGSETELEAPGERQREDGSVIHESGL